MPPPVFQPSLQLIEGKAGTDSTEAELTQALVVQVTSPTGPRPGVVVRFGIPLHAASPYATVAKLNSFQYSEIVAVETDDRGRASALVRLGRVLGEAKLVVTVPEFGLADTAKYNIVAGNALLVSFTVDDTSSGVGVTRQLSASAVSQHGNNYAGQIEFRALTQTCAVAGSIVTTVAVGTCRVEAIAGAARDTLRIWVLPAVGFLAGKPVFPGDSIVLFNLVTGRVRTLGYRETSDYPTARPNGVVVYQEGNSIGIIEPDGSPRYPLLPGQSWLFQTFARLSARGDTVFFYGSQGVPTVFRVRRDGTGLTPIFQQDGIEGMDVSPDGKQLVFARGSELFVIGSNGAALRALGQNGYSPRWSPTGE
jgi:hypothetical protein